MGSRMRSNTYLVTLAIIGALASPNRPVASGSTAPARQDGSWTAVSGVPAAAWSAALLPTGKVLLFQSGMPTVLWDPKTREFTRTAAPSANLFCAGLALLGDGRLLTAGGHVTNGSHQAVRGLKSAEVFDPWTQRWARLPDMIGGER